MPPGDLFKIKAAVFTFVIYYACWFELCLVWSEEEVGGGGDLKVLPKEILNKWCLEIVLQSF